MGLRPPDGLLDMLTGRLLKPRVVLLEVMAVWLLALMGGGGIGWKFWFKIGKKKDISSLLSFSQSTMSFDTEHSFNDR